MNKVIRIYCKILIITYFLFGSFAISSIENVNSSDMLIPASNHALTAMYRFRSIINNSLLFPNYFDDVKTFIAKILLSATDQVAKVGVPDSEEWILLLAGVGLICVQILNNSRNS